MIRGCGPSGPPRTFGRMATYFRSERLRMRCRAGPFRLGLPVARVPDAELRRDDTPAQSIADEIRLGAQTQLSHQVAPVGLGGPGTDGESRRHPGVTVTLGGKLEYLALPRRERVVEVERGGRRALRVGLDRPIRQRRAEVAAPGGDFANRLDQIGRAR